MRRRGAAGLIASALAVALAGPGAGAPAAAPVHARTTAVDPRPAARHNSGAVPYTFVGVDADGPLFDPTSGLNLARQFDTMVTDGIGTVRTAFSWAAAQPYQTWADVPAAKLSQFTHTGNVPTNFTQTDQLVGLAAERGMTVLPTVLYAPSWDAVDNPSGIDDPATPGPYADYLTALVQRYGPNGSFWTSHPQIPRVPIRMWQIWNEENLAYYWHQPFGSSYAALLGAAHDAIKRADPGARVVLGALTNFAWVSIGQIYRVAGARKLFDVVSVNGFTKQPADVIVYLRLMRRALDHFKDGAKPLIATELSWPSARGETQVHYDFDTTEAGQARNIALLLPVLGADRFRLRLLSFYYYTWISVETYGASDFSFAGLEGQTSYGAVFAKPGLIAFRHSALALEHCRRKSTNAMHCAQRAP